MPRAHLTPSYRCQCCGYSFSNKGTSHRLRSRCPSCAELGKKPPRWPRRPKNFYVYGWYDDDHLFYVGCGSLDRALERHHEWDGFGHQSAYCELRRAGCRFFRVRIFMDGMTEPAAAALEAALINIFQPECNQRAGTGGAKEFWIEPAADLHLAVNDTEPEENPEEIALSWSA